MAANGPIVRAGKKLLLGSHVAIFISFYLECKVVVVWNQKPLFPAPEVGVLSKGQLICML